MSGIVISKFKISTGDCGSCEGCVGWDLSGLGGGCAGCGNRGGPFFVLVFWCYDLPCEVLSSTLSISTL